MKDQLPVPAFATEEEQIKGAEAICNAGDTTAKNVAKAVALGPVLSDSDFSHVRYLKKEGNLLYHIFRGPKVPEGFWGDGEFGLQVLRAAEQSWPSDMPLVEFHKDVVRAEVVEDDPSKPSKYPEAYYGAYLVVVPSVDRRPLPPDEERFRALTTLLDELVEKSVREWSNGS